jgi:hypothetical protein
MAVSHHPVAPVWQLRVLHHGQEHLGLRLDGLGQKSAGAAPQNGRQGVVNCVGLTEGNNGAIHRHGVSLLREVQAGFHPPRYVAFLTEPSPRFRHSSLMVSPNPPAVRHGGQADRRTQKKAIPTRGNRPGYGSDDWGRANATRQLALLTGQQEA